MVYRRETQPQFDSLTQKVLLSVQNLIGISKEHKSRRKRDLQRENRIDLVDHNELDKDEESAEFRGLGFDELLQRFARANRSLKIAYPSIEANVDRQHNGIIRALSNRRKRSAELDRVRMRRKRRAMEYEALENEYSRCKKETPNEKECDKIYDKLKKLSEEINRNFQEMTNLIRDFKGKKDGDLMHELDDSFPKKKNKKKKKKDEDSKESEEKKEKKTYKKDKPALHDVSTTEAIVSNSTISDVNEETADEITDLPETDETVVSDETSQPPSTITTPIAGSSGLPEVDATVTPHTTSQEPPINSTQSDSHTEHNQTTTLDEFIKAKSRNMQKTSTTLGPYEPKSHRPVTHECVTNLDDLLQTVDEFKSVNTTKKNCTKTTTEATYLPSDLRTLQKQPEDQQENEPPQSDSTPPSHIGQPPFPIHEDLSGQSGTAKGIHDFIMHRSRNRFHHHHDGAEELPQAAIESPEARASKPVSSATAGDAFLNLCDQVRSQHHQDPIRTLSSYRNNFQAQQYGGLGHTSIPASGETMKASTHMMFNPAYAGYVPNHFCIYQIPPAYGVVRPVYPGGQTHPGGKLQMLSGSTYAGQPQFVQPNLLTDLNLESVIDPRVDMEGA